MRYIAALGALAGTALLSTTALAADLYEPAPVYEPVVAPVLNYFEGGYIGLHGGWGWGESDASYVEDIDCPSPGGFLGTFPCPASLDPDGAFVGVQIGWNFVFGGGFMLGIEGDYSAASLTDTQEVGTGIFATEVNMEVDQMATILARAGWVWGRWMPYIAGGWGWAHADRSTYNVLAAGFGGGNFSDSQWHEGWVAAIGSEFAINEHWTLKGEYRYFDGGSQTYNNIIPVDVDLTIQTVRFGVNYNF